VKTVLPESVGNMKKQGAKIYDLLIALYSRIVLSNALSPEPQYRLDIFNNIKIHIKIARRHILRLAEDIKKQRVKIYKLLIALYLCIVFLNFLFPRYASPEVQLMYKFRLMYEIEKYYQSEKNIITKPVIKRIVENRKVFYNGRWPLKILITGTDYNWQATFQPDSPGFFQRISFAIFHWNLNPTPPDMTNQDLFVLKSVEMDFLYSSDEKFLKHNK